MYHCTWLNLFPFVSHFISSFLCGLIKESALGIMWGPLERQGSELHPQERLVLGQGRAVGSGKAGTALQKLGGDIGQGAQQACC